MVSTMTTRNAGRRTATTRGRGISEQDDREGERSGDQVGSGRGGCLYKDFMACNPKDYDGMFDAIVYTRWIEKMESVQDMSACGENQKVKYTSSSFINKALTWWNSQVQTRGREAAVGMT
ncbi:hypothetical protein Tco_0935680 [Tanacetum coccineum]